VRADSSISVLKCTECGLIFIDTYKINYQENEMMEIDPFDTMDLEDTERRFSNYKWLLHNARLLDYGCGRGSFLKKIKDSGIARIPIVALEPNKLLREDLSKNFSLYLNVDSLPNVYFNYITMFHVVEHLVDPITILNELYEKLENNGKIIIEVPNHDDVFHVLYDCKEYTEFKYVPYHKFYFTYDTLRMLLSKTLFKTEVIRTEQRYDLSNHLHWLAKKKPNGHTLWSYLNSEEYKLQLELLGIGDTLTAVVKKC